MTETRRRPIPSPAIYFDTSKEKLKADGGGTLILDAVEISDILRLALMMREPSPVGKVRYSESFVEATFTVAVEQLNTPGIWRYLVPLTNELRNEYRAIGWDDLTMTITTLPEVVPLYEFCIKLTYR